MPEYNLWIKPVPGVSELNGDDFSIKFNEHPPAGTVVGVLDGHWSVAEKAAANFSPTGFSLDDNGRYELVKATEDGPGIPPAYVAGDWIVRTTVPEKFNVEDLSGETYWNNFEFVSDVNGTKLNVSIGAVMVDVNEAPEEITLTGTPVADGAAGVAVGELSAFDEDDEYQGLGGVLDFSIDPGANGNLFRIDTSSGKPVLKLQDGQSLSYANAPNEDANGRYYEVVIRATDQGGYNTPDGSQGGAVASETQTVRVYVEAPPATNAPPDAPTYSGTPELDENFNTTEVLVTVGGSDDPEGGAVTYHLADDTEASNPGGRFVVGSDGKITLASNVTLDYEATDLNEEGSGATFRKFYTVKVVAKDAAGNPSTVTDVKIYVNPVNEAPGTATYTPGTPINETAGDDTVVGTLAATDPDGTTPSYVFADTGTTLSADGAFKIVGNEIQVADASKIQVGPAGQVFTYQVKATDGSLQSANATDVSITVNDVPPTNTPPSDPVVQGAVVAVDENTTGSTVVATVQSTDNEGSAFEYQLVTNPGGRFSINNTTGAITLTGTVDYETDPDLQTETVGGVTKKFFTVQVKAVETAAGGESSGVTTVKVYINDINEAPSVPTYTGTPALDENVNNTNVLVTVGGSADPEGGAVTYDFAAGGNPSGRFVISANGEITLATGVTLDYEAGDLQTEGSGATFRKFYTVKVVAKDAAGNPSAVRDVKIYVNDVNEKPAAPTVVTGTLQTVDENFNGSTAVAQVQSSDQDAGQTLTYSLVDTFGGKFSINATTGVITLTGAIDFETTAGLNTETDGRKYFNVQVRATDNGTGNLVSDISTVKVYINDVVETPPNIAPTGLAMSGGFIGEYAAVGAVVGQLSAADANGDPLSYSLVDNAGGRFTIVGNELRLAGAVNFEEATSHQIKVRVSDNKGASIDQTFTVAVGDELTLYKRGKKKNDKLNGTGLDDLLKGGTGKGKDTIKGNAGDDKLYGESGNDKLYGGHGFDRLYGGKDNDTLKGDAGNDWLYGEDGSDKLYGGAGQDVFVFNKKLSKTKNYDQIKDFKVVDDTIWLDNKIFKKLGKAGSESAPAALNKKFFKIGKKAKDKDDYIVYDNKKGILYYDVDGKGKKEAVEIAKINKKLKLTVDDFFVI